MRRSLFAALLATMLLAWPAEAQLFPSTTASDPPADRVIMDTVFWTLPIPVIPSCMELPAGQLTVALRLVGDSPDQPVSFELDRYKYQDAEPGASIHMNISRQTSTTQVPIAGGRYCYVLTNTAAVAPGTGSGSAGPVQYAQDVAIRLTLTPQ